MWHRVCPKGLRARKARNLFLLNRRPVQKPRCAPSDVFTVQDEITRAVTTAIAPAIADAERQRALRRPPGAHDAWIAYQRRQRDMSKATREDNRLAQRCFAKAISLDANFSGGYHGLAVAQMRESGLFATRGMAEARVSITDLARRAIGQRPSTGSSCGLLPCSTLSTYMGFHRQCASPSASSRVFASLKSYVSNEPPIYQVEDAASLPSFSLIAPQPRHAHCRA
jgi:hypothetical protein